MKRSRQEQEQEQESLHSAKRHQHHLYYERVRMEERLDGLYECYERQYLYGYERCRGLDMRTLRQCRKARCETYHFCPDHLHLIKLSDYHCYDGYYSHRPYVEIGQKNLGLLAIILRATLKHRIFDYVYQQHRKQGHLALSFSSEIQEIIHETVKSFMGKDWWCFAVEYFLKKTGFLTPELEKFIDTELITDKEARAFEIENIKRKLENQDKNIELVFSYLDELMEKQENPTPRKQIGFRVNPDK